MAVRIAELRAEISADDTQFQRTMNRSEKSAQRTAESIERSFKGDPFRDFDKNLRKIDRMLSDLEKPRDIGKAFSGGKANFREAGQFLEELSRGDAVEGLTQLAAGMGGVGIAAAGVGLAIGGMTAGIVALTGHMIEQEREISQLSREYKLTGTQIQSLQVLSELTGESVKDLAEDFKAVAPQARQLEELVKSSGAAIDDDLRAKTQDASLAWQELQLAGMGALNTIAREGLPEVAEATRDLTQLVHDLSPAWSAVGSAVGSFADFAKDQINDVRRYVALLKGELFALGQMRGTGETLGVSDFLTRSPLSVGLQIAQQIRGNQERAKDQFGTLGGSEDFGDTSDRSVFNIPRLGSGGRSKGRGGRGGASDAEAAQRAEIALARTQAQQLLALEKERSKSLLELTQREHEEKMRFIGDNLNAEIDEFNRYYAERIAIQRRSYELEIETEANLWRSLDAEQKSAKKRSEKLRLEAEKERVAGRIDILRLQQDAVSGKEAESRSNDIRKAQEEQHKTARDLASAYRNLQTELISLTGSPFDQFQQDLQKTTRELEHLASVVETMGRLTNNPSLMARGKDAFGLVKEYTDAANRQFELQQLGRDRQGLEQGRGLQMDRINRQEDAGLLAQGKAYEQRLQVQRAMKDLIVENLQQEQLILETLGRHNEALQVQREIEQAIAADLDVRAIGRLRSFQDDLTRDFNGIIDGLVFGTESVTDVLREGLRNLVNTSLQTFQETIVENMTGIKGGLGGLLGTALGGLLSGFMGFGSIPKRASGGPVMAGMPYWINEETPNSELFVPTLPGYVMRHSDARQALTNAASGQMRGNVTIVQTFHISTPSNHITRESQQQVATRAGLATRQALERNT